MLNTAKMLVKDAPTVWNSLRGLICVYKPAGVKVSRVRNTIICNICAGLNELECRPPINYVSIEGNPLKELSVIVKPSYADNELVVGPRYQPEDLVCSWSNFLGLNTSGVLLLGLRNGTKLSKRIRENFPTRAYRIKGILGNATDTYFSDGKVVERTTFKHVKMKNMERILSYMQASHQRKMFEMCGVDMQSQEAYELASKGLIRPSNSKIPIIYGIKCVQFNSPEFTIEMHCVNEYEMYLKTLIHEIGQQLHSSAHCTGIQCIRHSHFNIENALLQKHWKLQYIIENMEQCAKTIDEHSALLHQDSVTLT